MEPALFLANKRIATIQNDFKLCSVIALLETEYLIDTSELYFTCNGKRLSNPSTIITQNVYANFRQNGGKGGFGSMLRAIGAQIEKTTNREACRDLSGRRLRDINEEKRLKAWLDKQKDREAEAKERKRKKLEKLMAVPKHNFKDAQYESARTDMTENVSEAVEEGFRKAAAAAGSSHTGASATGKRKAPTAGGSKNAKKAALWIDDDLGSTCETDSSDEETDVERKKKKADPKELTTETDSSEDENDENAKGKNLEGSSTASSVKDVGENEDSRKESASSDNSSDSTTNIGKVNDQTSKMEAESDAKTNA